MEDNLIVTERIGKMCAITGFGILGLLGWGVYSAGKAVSENRSRIAHYTSNMYKLPETTYQTIKVKVDQA